MKRRDRRPAPPGRLITAGGLRWHAVEDGQAGPGLVLLHGYLASTAIWQPAIAGLAPTVRTLAVDLPGAGYSERPATAPYDLPWFAERLIDLLDAVGLERPLLGGHSLGGAIALHAAARHPDRVAGLVLVSPFVYAPPPPPGLRLARAFPRSMELFFRSPLGRAMVRGMVRRAVYSAGDHDALASASSSRLLDNLDADGGWAAASKVGLQAHAHSPQTDLIARIEHPCLVLWGGQDRAHSTSLAERLVAELPGPTRLSVFPGSAHNCHEEEPERFCAEVRAWMETLHS